MKKIIKRIISVMLALAIIIEFLPITTLKVMAMEDSNGVVSISNEYISVDVSGKNGGFLIKTKEGDKLIKSDDNKALLYHRDEYDTSFTSFEVTYADGSTKQYLFGGSYGFLGMSSSDVEVKKINETEIHAVWEVNDLVFTQKLSLVSSGANEHGMVSIAYDVENKGSSPVSIKARILLDTAFDKKDYGTYQVVDANNKYRSIWTETVLTASDSIPQNFFANDDPYNPSVTAYTVSKQGQLPYQVAFGHWNNLAATLFDFAPDITLDFTNTLNKYMTADSAYALYYDIGSVPASGGKNTLITYYGVYSHHDEVVDSTMTLDITAPTALTLNSKKNAYVPLVKKGIADFSVQMVIKNLLGEQNADYSRLTLAVHTSYGLKPLNSLGQAIEGIEYDNYEPYNRYYVDVEAGETVSDVLYFSAIPAVNTEYRKIKLQVYNTSVDSTLTQDKILAEKVFYVLCPGTDGGLPKYTFTSLTPNIIYYSGTRHLYVTGTNIDIIYASIQSGNCTIKAYTEGKELTIPKENVLQPATDKLDIILADDMVTGEWYLQFEWSDEAVKGELVAPEYQKQTAPALKFMVSDDKQYKNDTYGVIAVVQLKSDTEPVYQILSFRNEKEFQAFKEGTTKSDGTKQKEYEEILLEFRGEFEIKESVYDSVRGERVPTKVKATSLKSSVDSKATNCITINNCIDFEAGVLTIFYTDSSSSTYSKYGDILVLFDGSLYTSNSRTSIWKGEAGLTKIVQGKEFGLIPYDTNGEREEDFDEEAISLVWPSILGTAQSILGMAFNLAYGRLGVMKDDDGNEVGRLISFGAKLDLGFLIPGKKDDDNNKDEKEDTYWTRLKAFWRYYKEGERGEYADWLYCNYDKFPIPIGVEKGNDDDDDDDKAASVMVEDILYGCGKGFIGLHFKVNVGIPNYIEKMPQIKGELEINTIGNWMIGLEGEMEFETFGLEVELTIKSYKNIPVPDKIYFFVSGFEPGLNIDAHGVIWITGGGGGIDNLYDTIFLTGGVPPLKILMSVTFDIIKVLSARCDFSIGPRGISFSASNIKIKATDIIALKKAAMQFDWYPDLYIMGSIQMSLADLIQGGGYIVLEGKNYSEWFFEAFVRAALTIPKSMPFVGGMTVTQVDLGLNTQKIWGQLKVLRSSLGVTYYWGGDLIFGEGEISKPTYPNLLGFDDIPVYHDAETGETLYMRVGTNLSIAAQPETADDLDHIFKLMATTPSVYSTADRLKHKFNLGSGSDSDALIDIKYAADSLEDAISIAQKIIANGIKDGSDNEYVLILYDGTNPYEANANVTYNPDTSMGALTITMTTNACYEKDWYVTTPKASQIILYNVAPVPEITSVSGSANGTKLDINWSGTLLTELDSVKYYLVSDKDTIDEGGYPIGELTDSTEIGKGSKSFTVPADVPEGEYYIRAVYSKNDVINSAVISAGKVFVENDKTPDLPSISQVKPAGDLKFDIILDKLTANAYMVNVYEYDADSHSWVYSDVNGIVVEKANIVNNTITVGGSYIYTDNNQNTSSDAQSTSVVKGLAAGKDYRIGVIACNYVDSNGDGEYDSQVFSKESFYSSSGNVTTIDSATSVTMPEPNPPVVNVTADKVPVALSRTVGNKTESYDTYASSDITFTVSADKDMTGTWALDGEGGISGTVAGTTVSIPLTGLDDGDHTLIIKGTGPNGDGFRHAYTFAVDTLAPKLLLSSPTNGSFFNEDGTLTVAGTTDSTAFFSIYSDGMLVCANKSISELGGSIDSDGVFSFKVALPNAHSASSHKITIIASDIVGNATSVDAEVVHGGLSNIQSLAIYADGVKWDNDNIVSNPVSSNTYQLSLCAQTNKGVSFYLTDEKLVSWNCTAVEGTASIDSKGTLTVGADSVGFVTGSLHVAETGSLTSSITFGAERFSSNIGNYTVVTSATQGGRVTGGGTYAPGDTVTLTAIPDSGYKFTGWILEGVSVSDISASTISFTMPDRNVVVTAKFERKLPEDSGGGSPGNTPEESSGNTSEESSGNDEEDPTDSIVYSIAAIADQKVSLKIPSTVDVNQFVAYYLVNGKKVYVPMSIAEDGMLTFIAPATGKYTLVERKISFTDVEKHWAKDYIESAAARGLFTGIGDNKFDPNGKMTRAMFVTVLWRLAGRPSGGAIDFKDAAPNSYYSDALAWASNNGLVSGYGNGLFGVNDKVTREQMCVIFVRFLEYMGFDISEIPEALPFADEHAISSWAAQAVKLCRSLGIVNGKSGNIFDPAADATRAECCAMFIRLIKIYLNSIR